MMLMLKPFCKFAVTTLVFITALVNVSSVYAQARSESSITSELVLPLYKSGILELQKSPSRVSVGNSAIADILILRSNQVHVSAKALGSTNVVFWDSNDSIFATVNIEVTHDLQILKEKLFRMMPSDEIQVNSAQENIILQGHVDSAENVRAAVQVAESFLPECINSESSISGQVGKEGASNAGACEKAKVINLLKVEGSHQVMLEVKVAEVSRTLRRSIDPSFNFLDVGTSGVADSFNGAVTLGANGFTAATQAITGTGFFFSDLIGNQPFRASLELSKSKGLAKILAEPNLTTLTGKPAEFKSGGQFPYPVATDDGLSVAFKDYGVAVGFTPIILDNNRIRLELAIEVSEVDNQNAIDVGLIESDAAFIVPSLTRRFISNTVELGNGQTIGIAGLIRDNLTQMYNTLPGIGDIPILGRLFRSQEFINGQTELVIFVTPHLAKPISPDKVKLPTDSFVAPNDIEFYLLGRMESMTEPTAINRRRSIDGGFDGVSFGHDL